MNQLQAFFAFLGEQDLAGKAQGLVKYLLVLTLVAIVIIVVLTLLGPYVGNVFSEMSCTFP